MRDAPKVWKTQVYGGSHFNRLIRRHYSEGEVPSKNPFSRSKPKLAAGPYGNPPYRVKARGRFDLQVTNSNMRDEIITIIREVLAPLVREDGGELYLVEANSERVALHLSGKFAGCPGNDVVARRVFEPALRAVCPKVKVSVTWGRLLPPGAKQVDLVVAPESSP